MGFDLSRLSIAPLHVFQMVATFESDDLGLGAQGDRGAVLDAANQIARHGIGQLVRSDQHVHVFGHLRQVHSRLPSRVTAADHNHFFALA